MKLDSLGNPEGSQYDLVKDGGLDATILIYDNHGGIGTKVATVGLGDKGLRFNVTSNETEMARILDQFDELWIIPCKANMQTSSVQAIYDFVNSGKGVWIFGGNTNKPSN